MYPTLAENDNGGDNGGGTGGIVCQRNIQWDRDVPPQLL